MGRDLTTAETERLFALSERCGLCAILQTLSEYCGTKANACEDTANAVAWARAEGVLGITTLRPTITAIGLP